MGPIHAPGFDLDEGVAVLRRTPALMRTLMAGLPELDGAARIILAQKIGAFHPC